MARPAPLSTSSADPNPGAARMLKVTLDVAPQPFDFAPVVLVLLLGVIVAAIVIFALRYVRKNRR
ncbi:MAG TPA: hypothetical protein VIT20_07405 [Propionibacteriaceae bacterium]